GIRDRNVTGVQTCALPILGIHANRLYGGIKSYRQWVVHELKKQDFPPNLYVLNGYTGSGKTIILQKLATKGYPVIDLEKLAGHRDRKSVVKGQRGRQGGRE